MKQTIFACILALTFAGLGVPILAAQTSGSAVPSLGTLARKLRAERKEEKRKPVTVFTNDSLPAQPSIEESGEANPSSKQDAKAKGESAGASEGTHGEKYFSKQAQEIRDRLSLHQRELAVLEQKIAQAQMVYYPNPQTTLQQESTPAFQSDVNQIREDIAKKKQQIEDDQKAMDDLREELRREGGDPGWIR